MGTVMGTLTDMSKDNRREYASGSVFQRGDGLWIGRIEAGWNSAGNRRRIQVSAKTEAECKRRLTKKRREFEQQGAPAEGVSTRTTVKAWADAWIESQRAELGAKTHGNYAAAIRKWIIPTIGRKPLTSLEPKDIRAVTKAEESAGNAAASARQTRRVLMKMLGDAVADGHVIAPRVFKIKAIEVPDPDRDAIPLDDASLILDAALTLPHASRWVVAFYQGLRPAEALGLTWDRVDLENQTITIDQQLTRLPYLDRAAETFQHPRKTKPIQLWKAYHLIPPKTARGRRVIPMTALTYAALSAWSNTGYSSPHNLVWPRPNGQPKNPLDDRREFVALQDAAQVAHVDGTQGRRYELYEARHTTATILMEIKAEPSEIEAIMGHSVMVSRKSYQHVRLEVARRAMERVGAAFGLEWDQRGELEAS